MAEQRDPWRHRTIEFDYDAPEGWDTDREDAFVDALFDLAAEHELSVQSVSGGPEGFNTPPISGSGEDDRG